MNPAEERKWILGALRYYFTFAILEGASALVYFLSIPGDPKNAWLFNDEMGVGGTNGCDGGKQAAILVYISRPSRRIGSRTHWLIVAGIEKETSDKEEHKNNPSDQKSNIISHDSPLNYDIHRSAITLYRRSVVLIGNNDLCRSGIKCF